MMTMNKTSMRPRETFFWKVEILREATGEAGAKDPLRLESKTIGVPVYQVFPLSFVPGDVGHSGPHLFQPTQLK
jgi:hypothetical protein